MAKTTKNDKLTEMLAKEKIECYADGIGNFGYTFNGYSLGGYTDGDPAVSVYFKWMLNGKLGGKKDKYCSDDTLVGSEAKSYPHEEWDRMRMTTPKAIAAIIIEAKQALLKEYPLAKKLKQSPTSGPIRKNLLVVFEGVDNSGKTTISKRLRAKMPWFHWSKEPRFSTKYADYLNSDAFKGKDAAREVKYLRGRLEQQDFYNSCPVMLDRYLWTGLAYAKTFSPSIFNFCEALYTEFEIFKKPDIIFYMRTPLATCYDREPALKKTPGRLERIEKAYDDTKALLADKVPIVEVDGRMSIKECVDFCYNEIVKRFPDQTVVK